MHRSLNSNILEHHQSIIDGYVYRLSKDPSIRINLIATTWEEFEKQLVRHEVDLLLLGLNIPVSEENPNLFPAILTIRQLLQKFPALRILVISMFRDVALIRALLDTGIRGFILKDDQASIQQLASIVCIIAKGGSFISKGALPTSEFNHPSLVFSCRQMEALSVCAAYPDSRTPDLAKLLGMADSTFRNLMSEIYQLLGVHTRAAAIVKAQQMGLLPLPHEPAYNSN